MSFRLVFDGSVEAGDYTVSVMPDIGATGTLSAGAVANELSLSFDAGFPTGRYEITLSTGARAVITFPMCFSQGDANCSGDTTGLDLALIQSPGSWNKDLSEPTPSPRADVNRDGQVTALDLAKAQSPAFWNQPVPPLTCGCPWWRRTTDHARQGRKSTRYWPRQGGVNYNSSIKLPNERGAFPPLGQRYAPPETAHHAARRTGHRNRQRVISQWASGHW